MQDFRLVIQQRSPQSALASPNPCTTLLKLLRQCKCSRYFFDCIVDFRCKYCISSTYMTEILPESRALPMRKFTSSDFHEVGQCWRIELIYSGKPSKNTNCVQCGSGKMPDCCFRIDRCGQMLPSETARLWRRGVKWRQHAASQCELTPCTALFPRYSA